MIVVVAILLAVFVLPHPWGVVAVGIGVVLEVAETALWIRLSRRAPPRLGPETLVGSLAVVVEPCRPLGVVRFHGERWQARCAAGADRGVQVRVTGLDGLVLQVEPAAVER